MSGDQHVAKELARVEKLKQVARYNKRGAKAVYTDPKHITRKTVRKRQEYLIVICQNPIILLTKLAVERFSPYMVTFPN